jgi:hypothetical protein
MATIYQIDANRRNARKSTGPRTPQGKAGSSMNALKSGIDAKSEIISGENIKSFTALTQEYIGRFNPLSPEERHYLDVMIRADWQIRRLSKADAQIWLKGMQSDYVGKHPLGEVFVNSGSTFIRLQRRIDSTHRIYRGALRELQRLQSARQPDPPTAKTPPEIGFVPSNLMLDPRPQQQLDPVA